MSSSNTGFDAVDMMRLIRDRISTEIEGIAWRKNCDGWHRRSSTIHFWHVFESALRSNRLQLETLRVAADRPEAQRPRNPAGLQGRA